MATSTIDFRSPAAGFDQPLALWLACHERVARMSQLLLRLVEHVKTRGANEEAQVAAVSVRRYFDESAPRHHEDEEQDLFPRLRARLVARDESVALAQVTAAIATLQGEHQQMAAAWHVLRERLLRIENGEAAMLDADFAQRFADGYRAHIALEEGVIAPAMQRCFSESDWQAIGRAMAERRGVDWDSLQ